MGIANIYQNSATNSIEQFSYPQRRSGMIKFTSGTGEFSMTQGILCLFDVKVVKQAQGKGIGTLLMLDLLKFAREHIGKVASYECADVLWLAQPFYHRLGFRPSTAFSERLNARIPPAADPDGFAGAYFSAFKIGLNTNNPNAPIFYPQTFPSGTTMGSLYKIDEEPTISLSAYATRAIHRRKCFGWQGDPELIARNAATQTSNWRFLRTEAAPNP